MLYAVYTWPMNVLSSYSSFTLLYVGLYYVRSCVLTRDVNKQRCHSISVHNVFYDIFGFSEFNRLCSVYSVCGQSRGYFIASVWDVFRDLVSWLLYWLYCFFRRSVCLSLHIVVWIKIINKRTNMTLIGEERSVGAGWRTVWRVDGTGRDVLHCVHTQPHRNQRRQVCVHSTSPLHLPGAILWLKIANFTYPSFI